MLPIILHLFTFCALLIQCTVIGYQVKDAPLLKAKPQWLKVCRQKDPNMNKCLNDLFLEIFPYLAVGIPEIQVDPFEPLPLDRVSVSKGTGPITLAGSLYNLIIKGPSNSTPSATDFDADKGHWNFDLTLPHLSIRSQYNLKGNILVLPLVGHGACELELYNIHTTVTTNISFPLKEDRKIVHIDNMGVKFKVGKMRIKLHNLFNGNKILGQTVNAFINQNAVEIINELGDSIGSSLAVIFKGLMNNIFTKIPMDLWYLPDEEYEKALKLEAEPKVAIS